MTNTILTISVFLPFAGALVSLLAGLKNERLRDICACVFTSAEFIIVLALFAGNVTLLSGGDTLLAGVPAFCGFGLSFTMDGFRAIYVCIAAFMWMCTCLLSPQYFAHHENRNRFYFFLLLTLGATMGVFLSADLYTTFIFFEIMSFTSYVWVAQEETDGALRAAVTYLAVAVIGGLVMLMGIFITYHTLGTVNIADLLAAARNYPDKGILYAAGVCMMFGFGAKAGAFPLHIWLPKAHPVAPAPASALLSGILTKTGIYGVIAISCSLFLHDFAWGVLILAIGVITMFTGALLAVFSIDLKRTLACSSMSQIGFILVGVGMMCLLGEENSLAVHGTFLHMVNHSLIKLVLFMSAGVIYMNTHLLDLNKIRGYGRKKPLLMIIFLIGAVTIAGIPGLGGYVSKTLLHESIVEFGGPAIMKIVEWIFLVSGGMTLGYMTKLFVAIFIEKNEDEEIQKKYDGNKKYMNPVSAFALCGSAIVLFIWGIMPYVTMDGAAEFAQGFMRLSEFGHRVHYFSWGNISGSLISIAIGAGVYALIRKFLMAKSLPLGGKVAAKQTDEGSVSASSIPQSGTPSSKYVDRWPARLDLENLIYRPLLLKVLPAVFEKICMIPDRAFDTVVKFTIPAARFIAMIPDRAFDFIVRLIIPIGTFFARILDTISDFSVLVLRKTALRDSPITEDRREGTIFSDLSGHIQNYIHRNDTPEGPAEDYVHAAAMKHEENKESDRIIARGIAFALALICIALIASLVYVLYM